MVRIYPLKELGQVPFMCEAAGVRPQGHTAMDTQIMQENRAIRVGSAQRSGIPTAVTPADQRLGGRTVMYARVSTADQTLAHQRSQAEAAGFRLDEVIADHGVSGVHTTLRERPEGRRLFDILRSGDTLVVRWVDRLGRNYRDVTDVIREFMRRGVIIRTVINGMVFDGSTINPMEQAVRDSLIAFMAALAEAQAEAIREAQKAGIAHAKANDDGTKYRGRKPTFTWEALEAVQNLSGRGAGVSEIAKITGLRRQTIYRILHEPDKQIAALAMWVSKPQDEKARI